MSAFYSYILIVHLFCAIFFIGYLFVDVLILGSIKKKNPNFNAEFFASSGTRIMPFVVLLLFLSGGALASSHFQNLNLLFVIKMSLAFVILALVIFSLFFHFVLKKPNPLGTLIHPLVFTFCVCIVFLAKLMNYLFVAF